MSRDIKFRAWVEVSKEMKYDELSVGFDGSGVWWDGAPLTKQPVVMQYTGLKDKNGTEIYEGDIVKGSISHSTGIEVVKYEGGGFSPFAIPDWEMTPHGEDIEVIGNIYENPELLSER